MSIKQLLAASIFYLCLYSFSLITMENEYSWNIDWEIFGQGKIPNEYHYRPFTWHDISLSDLGGRAAIYTLASAAILTIYSPFFNNPVKRIGLASSLAAAYSIWTQHTIIAIRAQRKIEKIKTDPLTPITLKYNYKIRNYRQLFNCEDIDDEESVKQEIEQSTLKTILEKYNDKNFPLLAAIADLEKLRKQALEAKQLFGESSHYSYYWRLDPTDPSGRKSSQIEVARGLAYQMKELEEFILKSEVYKAEEAQSQNISAQIWKIAEQKI